MIKDPNHAPTANHTRTKRGVPFPPIAEQQTCNVNDPRCKSKRKERLKKKNIE
jgi:hypothetical protein